MTRLTGRPIRVAHVALVACVVGLAFTARLRAQEDQFRRGVEAVENRQWQAAVPLLREAIKLRGQESQSRVGVNPILRTGGTEYLPHFFLGEALFGTGDCSGAVNEWVTSEQQGAIQKSRPEYLKRLQNGYAECDKKGVLPPGKLDGALAKLAGLIKEANTQVGTLANLGQANPDTWRADANAGTRDNLDRARAEIENSRARYQSASATRLQAHIEEATNAVGRATKLLATAESNFLAVISNQQSAQRLAQQVGELINTADAQIREIETKKVAFTPAMTTALQDGRDALSRARDRLSEGQKTLSQPTLNNARTLAQDASSRLKQVLDEILKIDRDSRVRVLGEVSSRADEAFLLLDTAVTTLDRFISERGNVAPNPDKIVELKRNADRVRRRLNDARKTENVDGIVAATRTASELRDQFTLIIGSFGPLTLRDKGVREQLEAGARQYLAGEYQQAIAALGDSENLDAAVPLRLHFHLFKAAASYELFLRSRETDQTLRNQAQAEVEHCKAIDSAFQPDARAFSPRFLSFYQSVNAPAAPPPPVATPPQVIAPSAN